MSTKTDLSDSARDFERVWPHIAPRIGGGSLNTLEGHTDDILKTVLDRNAGIDAIQILPTGEIQTLATRVQWASKSWNTFTIRKSRSTGNSTEFEKRGTAIEKGFLYPSITIQGYLAKKSGAVLSVAACHTWELFDFIKNNEHLAKTKTAPDGNTFYVVQWEEYEAAGHYIEIVCPDIMGRDIFTMGTPFAYIPDQWRWQA